ncbi:hypothetical protein T484DRAFT_1754340 [Baffinella frigidus]|nr:hypothetical protein T484DRAFT_1754340 [Cryptophyta sp. CCMP2293]
MEMGRIDVSSSFPAPALDDPGTHTMNARTLSSPPSPAPALVEDPGADTMNCRTVEDCDEFLSCIDDMRRIDASAPFPAPARIDDLETRHISRQQTWCKKWGRFLRRSCRFVRVVSSV